MQSIARVIVLTVFVLCGTAVLAQRVLADCPDNMVELNCGGLSVCRPPGSSCCGAVACAADLVCLTCDGNSRCAAPGSSCCGAVACPPDQECTTCGTSTMCRPIGRGCPENLD